MAKSAESKKGIGRRVAGWGIRKFRNPAISAASRKTLTGGFSAAREVLKPEKMNVDEIRAGLKGRYEDGGAARFREVVEASGLSEDQLPEMVLRHRRQALLNIAISIAIVAASFSMILNSANTIGILGGAAFSIFSLVFLTLAIRSDFSAWRIRMRRMDGFKAYLDDRFG